MTLLRNSGWMPIRPATSGYGLEDPRLLEPSLGRNAAGEPRLNLKAEAISHGDRLAHRT